VETCVHLLISGKPIYWPFPATGTLEPGAGTTLKITSLVDTKWSSKLTIGEDETNGKRAIHFWLMIDVLVLQVDGGKDTVSLYHAHGLIAVYHTTSQLSTIDRRPTSHSAQQAAQWHSTSASCSTKTLDRCCASPNTET
jgi:hypothetical protein